MLEIKNLSKSYKDVKALQHINITLDNGVYAILGPNGSGKSTLMNLLCDQLISDTGEILWEGIPIHTLKEKYFEILGYAPQQQGLYDDMSGQRFLTYMALLKKIPKKEVAKEVERVAYLVNMQDHLFKKCKEYSGGMKQRILVAQALLGKLKLLLFDEPTAGLDPKERVSLRQVFHTLAKDHILLIATHVVSDIETIAKEVIFLKQGNIILRGSISELLQNHQHIHDLEELYLSIFNEENTYVITD